MATKLVVVKMKEGSRDEVEVILKDVLGHIKKNNRRKRSVVVMSWNSSDDGKADLNSLLLHQEEQRDDIKALMDHGVIVVVAAGNHAKKTDDNGDLRPEIDTTPSIFEGPDYPLIVIGATDNTGEPADFSQGGDHLTIAAPGVDIECQGRTFSFKPPTRSGSSLGKFRCLPFFPFPFPTCWPSRERPVA